MSQDDKRFGAGEPLPEGSPVGSSKPTGAGEALPEGSPSPQDAQSPQQPDRGLLGSMWDHAANIGHNFEAGLSDTAMGVGEAGHKAIHAVLPESAAEVLSPRVGMAAYQDAMKPVRETTGTGFDKAVGYGGETLLEFLTGDAALKGLSAADKLLQAGRVAKLLQSSPRLIEAVRAGANLEKAKGLLSPAARLAIEQEPLLGRFVSAGLEAIRAGVVQGAQTTVRSGGDLVQGGKEGLKMAAGAAAFGSVMAPVGAKIAKLGEAANTIAKGAEEAANSQTARAGAGDAVQQFADRAAAAPDKADLVQSASDMVNNAHAGMGAKYAKGLQEQVIKPLQGVEWPMEGSATQQAAKNILGLAENNDEWMKVAGETTPVSANAKNYVERVANALKKVEKGEGDEAVVKGFSPSPDIPIAAGEKDAPYMMDINKLTKQRQVLMERARDARAGGNWSDSKAYSMMIDGIDKDISAMAEQTGNDEVSKSYTAIRGEYREMKELFENKDTRAAVNSIMRGDLSDLSGKLLGGQYGPATVDALKGIAEKSGQSWEPIAKTITQDIVRDGPEKLLNAAPAKIDRIEKMVGSDNMEQLRDFVTEHVSSQGASKLFDATPTKVRNYSQLLGQNRVERLTDDGFKQLYDLARNSDGNFDPEKMVKLWADISRKNPNGLRLLMDNSPGMQRKVEQTLDKVAQSADEKKSLYRFIFPVAAVAGSSGMAGRLMGPWGMLASGMVGLVGYRNLREMLNEAVSQPGIWKAVGSQANLAASTAGNAARTAGKYAAGQVAREIFSGTKSSLGQ